MSQWIRISEVGNIPPREGRAARVGDHEIAVFNLGETFLAVDGHCPHQGGPLCDGIVAGETVVCPLHAWKINLKSGEVERPTAHVGRCIQSYATKVEDGVVMVEWPEARRTDNEAA
jgi:nitrite reductase (NADH) small subunit